MKRTWRSALYGVAALGMIVYALPSLELNPSGGAAFWFALFWLGFAGLVLASQFYRLLRVDEARDRELAQIRYHKWERWERSILERASASAAKEKRGGHRARG
ncbi:hypothetical protein ACFQWB_03870 [Paenibacillus thermoaerophilus]|uniref:Uncharacterized protein n=1 Tax=Paenibacillus thermoaerophilus TaxID=1215385 RepID=A0ABW2UYW3_9BACL|nr:hypothetical protein [Paenibacillus thermoaerophilus]TMV16030.1 hypothetical protein FE781_09410 [Paenibacillus thermoaerophilus]